MGQVISVGLTQEDVADLIDDTQGVFNQSEVEGLYRRFRQLDKARKGFLTAAELENIPELSINPLAKRVSHLYEGANFKEFLRLLAAFSPRAPQDMKLQHMFSVYDVDGDGIISLDDLELVTRMLAGNALTEEQLQAAVSKTFQEAGVDASMGIDFKVYCRVLREVPLDMAVELPTAD